VYRRAFTREGPEMSRSVYRCMKCWSALDWPETAFGEITPRFPQADFLGVWAVNLYALGIQSAAFEER
jgi:hypothetical protein